MDRWFKQIKIILKNRLKQRSLYPASLRFFKWMNRAIAKRPDNLKKTFLVRLGGRKFKRIVFPDSLPAETVASNLADLRGEGSFPELIWNGGNEVWLEYLEGAKIQAEDEAFVKQVADFYAGLYRKNPVRVAIEKTEYPADCQANLKFLRGVGVLDETRFRVLSSRVEAETPQAVWVGYDYLDPFLDNFIREPGGALRVVDVESLRKDTLLGCGLVKALLVWKPPYGKDLLKEMRGRAEVEFPAGLPFTGYYYLSEWMKRSTLMGKVKYMRPEFFDRLEDLAG